MTDTPRTDEAPSTAASGGPWRVVAAVVAFLALVPVGFFYAASGLIVPGPWLFLMWLLYVALVVLAVRLARRRSSWVLAVPVAGGAAWVAIVSAGEHWLDWTA